MRVLQDEGCAANSLGVILTGDAEVRRLNDQYRGASYDTDVLSFALGDGATVDGEVYVNVDFAERHHQSYGASFSDEVCRYVIHGLLHLIGYDDSGPESAKVMREKEDFYLRIGQQITR